MISLLQLRLLRYRFFELMVEKFGFPVNRSSWMSVKITASVNMDTSWRRRTKKFCPRNLVRGKENKLCELCNFSRRGTISSSHLRQFWNLLSASNNQTCDHGKQQQSWTMTIGSDYDIVDSWKSTGFTQLRRPDTFTWVEMTGWVYNWISSSPYVHRKLSTNNQIGR